MRETQTNHIISHYFAPRGKQRMYALGRQISILYLEPTDKLIGVIGDAGSGKSALVAGMFPGLELTNNDDGVNIRPLPLLDLLEPGNKFSFFSPHTYHVDIRFENGFTQMSELADAIAEAVHQGKRVVVEHFELVYPHLNINADILLGVGEEVLVSRPTIFGPEPQEIAESVYASLPYRMMCHTAEDLCEIFISQEDLSRCTYDDVKHGFVMSFPNYPPDLDLRDLEKKVNDLIAQDLPVTYVDESHISIGSKIHNCDGPRTHVHSTGQIKDFHLVYHFIHDKRNKRYLLVGCVGQQNLDYIIKLRETEDI